MKTKVDEEKQILTQYNHMWENMQQANAQNYQVLGGVIAAAAAILTTGFTQIKENDSHISALIFLCVYIITFPGYRLLLGNRRHIWRLSTYIRVFLEEPYLTHLTWETRVANQRKLSQSKKGNILSSLITTNEWFTISVLNSVGVVAAIILLASDKCICLLYKISGIFIITIFFFFHLVLTWKQANLLKRGGKVEDDLYQSWMRVRETMSTK